MRAHFRVQCLFAACAFALCCGGCDAECIDEDGDGYGEHCEPGEDCDDQSAALIHDCSAPPPDCEAEPFAEGCPCLSGQRRACYEGPEDTLEVAACREGRQICRARRWSSCIDQVTPAIELCNGDDDDCDGFTDEVVRSACGGCDPKCTGSVWGEGPAPFELDLDDGLALTPRGELTLASEPRVTEAVWAGNTGESTVSKIDPSARLEVGRYRTGGEGPLALAITPEGDAVALDPSPDARSSLVRIAGDPARCVDRDDDGAITTSSGGQDVLPLDQDECVLLRSEVGEAGSHARALAAGFGLFAPDSEPGSTIWVGLANEERMLELDGLDGRELRSLELPGFAPHAAAFDRFGTLYVIDREGRIASIEPFLDPPVAEITEAALACYVLEDLAPDARGRLLLAGGECEQVLRYDPVRKRFERAEVPGVLDSRAVGFVGSTPFATSTAGRLFRLDGSPLELLDTFTLARDGLSPFESIALSESDDGALWVLSAQSDRDDAEREQGVLTRFDPETRRVTDQIEVGRLARAQGDLTGSRSVAAFAPHAEARHVFGGCGSSERSVRDGGDGLGSFDTRWARLHVAALVGAGARVVISLRHAQSVPELSDAGFEPLAELPADEPPFALSLPLGGVVEAKLELHASDGAFPPRVSRVGIEHVCPGPE